MDRGDLRSWHSNLKLSDYKSKVEVSVKRNKPLEDFRVSLLTTLNKPPVHDLNNSKDSKSSLASHTQFSHYNSLHNFRTLSGLTAMKNSGSNFYTPQQPLSPVSRNGSSYSHSKNLTPSNREPSPANRNFRPEPNNKHLSDLISIGTLSKATGLVAKGGLESMSMSYIRQLRHFCEQALQNLNN